MERLARRLAWVGVAVTVVALAFGVTVRLLGPEPPGVTEANVRRVRQGMTMREVEAILGGHGVCDFLNASLSGGGCITPYLWNGPGGEASVDFVASGESPPLVDRALSATFRPVAASGPLARLRALLGR